MTRDEVPFSSHQITLGITWYPQNSSLVMLTPSTQMMWSLPGFSTESCSPLSKLCSLEVSCYFSPYTVRREDMVHILEDARSMDVIYNSSIGKICLFFPFIIHLTVWIYISFILWVTIQYYVIYFVTEIVPVWSPEALSDRLLCPFDMFHLFSCPSVSQLWMENLVLFPTYPLSCFEITMVSRLSG